MDNRHQHEIDKIKTLFRFIQESKNKEYYIANYLKVLNSMLNKGWLGALPKALEIDVIHLPQRYIDQRNSVIDMLQCSLST